MATIKTDLICNLNQPVNVTYLHGNLFSQDNAGNTINVFVMDNGEPATIGGTVSANVIRSDGQTVAVSGAIEGNKAYVILPQACYAVPGVVHIIIKLTQNTTVTTIAAIVANVYMSTTDSVIDPGQVIPSIQALMALIEEAVDSIPTDYTGLLHTIAADYSSSKTYKVGDYAWESGVLKRCIVPITAAETYTAAHWTNAVIGDDLSALKSAIDLTNDAITEIRGTGKNLINPQKTTVGYMSAADGRIDISASYLTTDFIPIKNGQSITISPNCRKFLAFDTSKTAIQSTYINAGVNDVYTFTASADGFIRVSYLATNTTEQIEYGSQATQYESFYYVFGNIEFNANQKEYITSEIENVATPIETDITNIKTALVEESIDIVEKTTVTKTNDNTGYINQNGAYDSSTSYYHSDYIPVKEGDLVTAQTVGGTPTNLRFVAAYDNSYTIDKTKGWNNSGQSLLPYTVPSGIKYIIVSLYVTQQTTQIVKVTTKNGQTNYYAKTNFAPILQDKKWVACGDSFTQGDFSGLSAEDFQYQSGKYVGKNKVYPYVIGLRTGAEIANEAISGSTMAYVDGSHHEFSTPNGRYTQIPSDADYITLYFGINDSHHQIPIGTISDNTNTTFYGAWNIVMQYLIANHPNAKIGIIISNGCDTIEYPNAEIAIAKKYGVAYLDMNSDYKVPILFRVNGKPETNSTIIQQNYEHYRVSSTNGHPNVAMHEYESTIIQHWLEGM